MSCNETPWKGKKWSERYHCLTLIVDTALFPDCCKASLQGVLRSIVISVVLRRLRRGLVRGAGAPHRRLATTRANLKASRELAWTMLVLSLFQAIMVRGKKDCLYCSVL